MKEETFRVVVEPISQNITTENLLQKLTLMGEGCGIRIKELERIEDQDDSPSDDAGLILL
jgi:hypothetical protein